MVTHTLVDVFITDCLGDYVLDLERYKAVEIFLVWEYNNHKD